MSLQTRLRIDYYVGGVLHALLKPCAMLLGRLLRRDHDLRDCSEITYVKLLGGGSLVTAYPSLVALRDNARIKKLRLLGTSRTIAFGRALGVFDEIIEIRDRSLFTIVGDSLRAIAKLWRAPAIVDLEIHSRLSTVLCLLTLARNRIGAYTQSSYWRRSLATHLLFYNQQAPVNALYAQIARLFDCSLPRYDQCIARFRAHIAATAGTIPSVSAGSIAIAPACSELSRERMLRDEDWIDIVGRAPGGDASSAGEVHVLGGGSDQPMLNLLCERLRMAFPRRQILNHAGKLSLPQSAALIGAVGRLICIDSAVLHIARLMGVETESYWGPTDPAQFFVADATGAGRTHYRRISCSPCVHIANVAPCKGNNICMRFAVNPDCGLSENPIWLAEKTHIVQPAEGGA